MRWQIEEFVFCEKQQSLTSSEGTQQLEPIVVELLTYFCCHPDQIISRDQLVEDVWLGRMVTDNAVNRVITKLRKCLDDNPKQPKYIATFPKKGYRFIASISTIEDREDSGKEQVEKNELSNVSSKPSRLKNFYAVGSVAIVLLIGVLGYLDLDQPPAPITHIKALTREPGRESRPQISPNEKYLAYVEVRNKKMHQWIKSLADETAIEVSHGDSASTWVDSLSWNSDGSQFVYLVTTPNSCRYFIRQFNDMNLGEPKLIHNCPSGSYGKIAFTHDDNRVIYSENSGPSTPFVLFEMNLTTQKKQKLNQPELFLGGNSQFDLHPTENRLLISSPDKQQWEGFYSLDLETDQLQLLFKQDAYICCGIWDHTGKRVVLMGEHPANQLVSYNLQGKDKRIIYTGSVQIRVPERHVNGKDYLFSVVQVNQNISYYKFKESASNDIVNTTVDDRLATFSNTSDEVAYIGLSSGSEEVWLTDTNGKLRKKITSFKDSRHYIELLWSSDDKFILGLTLNEIHLINTNSGLSKILKIPQVEIRAVSWKDKQTLAYSMRTGKNWRVYNYNIETQKVSLEKDDWKYIHYSNNPENTLRLDQKDILFWGDNKQKVMDKDLLAAELVNGRTFNLKKMENKWYWQKRIKGRYSLFIKDKSLPENGLKGEKKQLLISDSDHFDVSKSGILLQTLASLNADIYQTIKR